MGSATGVVGWGVTGVAGSVVGSFDWKQGWDVGSGGPPWILWRGRWAMSDASLVAISDARIFSRHLSRSGFGHGEEGPVAGPCHGSPPPVARGGVWEGVRVVRSPQ